MRCVVCGTEFSYYTEIHKCDPKKEARIEAGRKAAGNVSVDQRRTFNQRLREGFQLLNMPYSTN